MRDMTLLAVMLVTLITQCLATGRTMHSRASILNSTTTTNNNNNNNYSNDNNNKSFHPSCLNSNAVPSLVILGAAKGGTTDVWDMLTTFHSKFNNPKLRPWKIEKEVNLLSPHMCSRDHNKHEGCTPTPRDVYLMLRCPRKLAIQENYTACKQFFETQQLRQQHPRQHKSTLPQPQRAASPLSPLHFEYSATARPTLFFLYTQAAQLFRQLTARTHTPSLFMVLLRNPVDRAVSLYNHGQMLKLAQHPDVLSADVLSVGYSLPLEDVLAIEFDLLYSSSECKRLLEDIHLTSQKWSAGSHVMSAQSFFTDLQRIGISFDRLRLCMSAQLRLFNSQGSDRYPLSSVSQSQSQSQSQEPTRVRRLGNRTTAEPATPATLPKAHGRHQVNLRPFGLLLEGLYGAQLSGWLGSGLFLTGSRNGGAQSLPSFLSSRLLIAQSELLFKDRFQFFNTVLLPFLHPAACANHAPAAASPATSSPSPVDGDDGQDHIISNSYITNGTSLSHIKRMSGDTKKNSKLKKKTNKIANQKLNKLPSSVLSPHMKQRLVAFYESNFPLSNLLHALMKLHTVNEGDGEAASGAAGVGSSTSSSCGRGSNVSSSNNNFFTLAPCDLKSWW